MLGALLGLANMAVIAFAMAIDIGEGAEPFGILLVLGALPALMAGLVLGAVAHRTREWSVGSRYAVIGIPALAVVLLFGSFIIPLAYYIPFACVPTLCAVRILECKTRTPSLLTPAIEWRRPTLIPNALTRTDPVVLGMMLGLANLVLIAVGMNGYERATQSGLHHHGTEECVHLHMQHAVGVGVFIVGLLPAVITGALIGRIAHRCRDWPVWSRLLVLVPPALAVVVIFGGGVMGVYEYVLPAMIPTLVAALVLERGTRERTLPAARAM